MADAEWSYEGERDLQGRPHGRGTQELAGRWRFEGRFERGARADAAGALALLDGEGGEEARYAGARWGRHEAGDEGPSGPGCTMTTPDGSVLRCAGIQRACNCASCGGGGVPRARLLSLRAVDAHGRPSVCSCQPVQSGVPCLRLTRRRLLWTLSPFFASSRSGEFLCGVPHGAAEERDSDGEVLFRGRYREGARQGVGAAACGAGTALLARWEAGELPEGAHACVFLYEWAPERGASCGAAARLVGEWDGGQMLRGRFADGRQSGSLDEEAIKAAVLAGDVDALLAAHGGLDEARWMTPLALDDSDAREPLESTRSEPRPTPSMGAGQHGLFATCDVAKGQIVGFFAGQPVPAAEVAARLPEENVCTLCGELPCARAEGGSDSGSDSDEEELEDCLQLPPRHLRALALDDPFRYATLGYHAHHEHRGEPNCTLERMTHPLFPDGCAALVAKRPIHKDEEATLDYTEAAPLRRRYMECTCEAGYYEWLRSVPEQALFVEASCIEAHGTVRVTRHGPWRALWFGEVEQGLSRAVAGTDMHDPVALGFDYIATMARRAEKLLEGWKRAPFQVVAVGLGTGALPAYLAHRLGRAGARVTALELDPTVARLARDVLKVSLAESTGGGSDVAEPVAKRQRMDGASADTVIIEVGDAAEWFAAARREGAKDSSPPLAAVLLDAYDAKGKVPEHLTRAGFLSAVAKRLAPGGAVVANVWRDPQKPLGSLRETAFCKALFEALGGDVELDVVPRDDVNTCVCCLKR